MPKCSSGSGTRPCANTVSSWPGMNFVRQLAAQSAAGEKKPAPTATPSPRETIDQLAYTYAGNRLTGIRDNSNNPQGFAESTVPRSSYLYDANGNLARDPHKGLTYAYNFLNKVAVQTTANGRIGYDYDAAGTVLHRAVYRHATGTSDDFYYVDGLEYQQSKYLSGLASVPTPEGRTVLVVGTPPAVLPPPVVITTPGPGPGGTVPANEGPGTPAGGGVPPVVELPADDGPPPPRRFVYEYHLRDHLGNLRVAFRAETGQQQMHLTMEPMAQEEGDYPLFRDVSSTRSAACAQQGKYAAAVSARQPGPLAELPVRDGDAVKVDFFYNAPAGVQYVPRRWAAEASGTTLDVADVPRGMYVLRLGTGATRRVVLE